MALGHTSSGQPRDGLSRSGFCLAGDEEARRGSTAAQCHPTCQQRSLSPRFFAHVQSHSTTNGVAPLSPRWGGVMLQVFSSRAWACCSLGPQRWGVSRADTWKGALVVSTTAVLRPRWGLALHLRDGLPGPAVCVCAAHSPWQQTHLLSSHGDCLLWGLPFVLGHGCWGVIYPGQYARPGQTSLLQVAEHVHIKPFFGRGNSCHLMAPS